MKNTTKDGGGGVPDGDGDDHDHDRDHCDDVCNDFCDEPFLTLALWRMGRRDQ